MRLSTLRLHFELLAVTITAAPYQSGVYVYALLSVAILMRCTSGTYYRNPGDY